VRHARADALDRLEPLLVHLRGFDALTEKARGVFYLKSRAFLHFHEDPAGLFADARTRGDGEFERFKVDDPDGTRRLVARVAAVLAGG
jgi:hypothetical protein